MSITIDAYQRRKRPKPEWSAPEEDEQVFLHESKLILDKAGTTFNICVAHEPYGPDRKLNFVVQRLPALFKTEHVGVPIVVAVDRPNGPEFAFRRVQKSLQPTQTDGTPGIDMIWSAVFHEFDAKYGIVNLGICASKPGEHGVCNAWDIGVSKPQTAEAIHAAILDIGNWLRARMLEAMNLGEGPGLPINGIIVMYQWCSREQTLWQSYGGVPHVSHVHVSAWPNLVPGWI